MAKKREQIILDEEFFDVMAEKAELLDRIFEDKDKVVIEKENFKQYDMLHKQYDKLPFVAKQTRIYEEPAEPKKKSAHGVDDGNE